MQTTALLRALVAALAVAVGCGDDDGAAAGLPQSFARSFDVQAERTLSRTAPLITIAREHRFVLRLEDDGAGNLTAFAGADGDVAAIALEAREDGTYVRTDSEPLLRRVENGEEINEVASYYTSIELRVEGAGPDRLTGTIAGFATRSGGDIPESVPFTGTLNGTPDGTAPTLLPHTGGAPIHVLDGFGVAVSEPLPPGARGHVVHVGGELALEGGVQPGESIVSAIATLRTAPSAVLPWGTELHLSFPEGLTDFEGNASASLPEVSERTMDDPGVLAPDGFETAPSASLVGDVQVFARDDGPLPIGGDRSLVVGPGGSCNDDVAGDFTARLAIPGGGAPRLRASIRYLALRWPCFEGRMTVGIPSVPAVMEVELPDCDIRGQTQPSGDERYGGASPVMELDVPLPAASAGDVIVRLQSREPYCHMYGELGAIQLDDLRVE